MTESALNFMDKRDKYNGMFHICCRKDKPCQRHSDCEATDWAYRASIHGPAPEAVPQHSYVQVAELVRVRVNGGGRVEEFACLTGYTPPEDVEVLERSALYQLQTPEPCMCHVVGRENCKRCNNVSVLSPPSRKSPDVEWGELQDLYDFGDFLLENFDSDCHNDQNDPDESSLTIAKRLLLKLLKTENQTSS
jgi:hypothetical protein